MYVKCKKDWFCHAWVYGYRRSTSKAQATISALKPLRVWQRVICSTDQNGRSLLILGSASSEHQPQWRRKEQMSSLNEHRQPSPLLMEFWSESGWMGVQTVNHYHYLLTWIIWRGSIKYFVSKKKPFLLPCMKGWGIFTTYQHWQVVISGRKGNSLKLQ